MRWLKKAPFDDKRWAMRGKKTLEAPRGQFSICRWCGAALKAPLRSWCSENCEREYYIRTSSNSVRTYVKRRDRGVCAECGWDTERSFRVLDRAVRSVSKREFSCKYRAARLAEEIYGIRLGWGRTSLWDADHIEPVEFGGGACGLDNYQTLCVPCHKRKTAVQAREAAEARAHQASLLTPPAEPPSRTSEWR